MDYELSSDVQALRTRVRSLVREHVPADFHGAFTDDPADLEVAQRFCRVLAEERLLTKAWPGEFGGGDGTVWEQTAVREEMWAANEPRGAQYMGVNWVGPVIMRYGTPAQRAEHLGRIGRGEVIWCQGFSEPNAGSDLASLATAAVADGEGWRLHGQKVWTSYASMAQWCFLLARTSHEEAKHRGITVFLVPMDRPGIEVRPLASMLGPHHLNEVFLDGVPVGPEDVLGRVGDGWSIVREVLAHERVGIARYARCDRLLNEAPKALGDAWAEVPAALRQRWTRALVHTRRARLLAYAVVDLQSRGEVDPRDTAAYRVSVTLNDQEVGEVLLELCQSLPAERTPDQERFRRDVESHWSYAMAATLASGSVEVQRILIARALLGPGA